MVVLAAKSCLILAIPRTVARQAPLSTGSPGKNTEWFALETNRGHSVIFEIASKYCLLDSFVDYNGYSISSKGFFPTVVDNGHLS